MNGELEIRIDALREFRKRVEHINSVLYTDLDKHRYVRVRTLVDEEIERLQNDESAA